MAVGVGFLVERGHEKCCKGGEVAPRSEGGYGYLLGCLHGRYLAYS
jgi:hypothetical protein